MIDNLITLEQLELLLQRKDIDAPLRNEAWLFLVRRLPCAYPGCKVRPAGTAHHAWTLGRGIKCSDFLSIPLCYDHHVFGPNHIQGLSPEKFKLVMGRTIEDVVRRTFYLISEAIKRGDFV